jgi:hypothetical protein
VLIYLLPQYAAGRGSLGLWPFHTFARIQLRRNVKEESHADLFLAGGDRGGVEPVAVGLPADPRSRQSERWSWSCWSSSSCCASWGCYKTALVEGTAKHRSRLSWPGSSTGLRPRVWLAPEGYSRVPQVHDF